MTCFKAAPAEAGVSGNAKEAEPVLFRLNVKNFFKRKEKKKKTCLRENKENTTVSGRETLTGPWREVISVARLPREVTPLEIWKISLDKHFLKAVSGICDSKGPR